MAPSSQSLRMSLRPENPSCSPPATEAELKRADRIFFSVHFKNVTKGLEACVNA